MREALFYQRTGTANTVVCGLCHHRCHIDEGRRGICKVRENQGGRLISLVYGRLVSRNIDPIEKKPLFHYLPGSRSLSIATVGCNFQCSHCQNYHISQFPGLNQGRVAGEQATPAEVVDEAARTGCDSISYTYVEPTIFYEFAFDCAQLAKQRGIGNVFVSNGYMTAEVVRHLAPVLDAINIDLKAFSDSFYRNVCKARLEPVLENIRLFHELGVLVEVTTLLIPGLNDGKEELRNIAHFLKGLSADIPWHVSAFRPTYQMLDRRATSPGTLHTARRIGLEEGLRFVYEGNLSGAGGEDTLCPVCGTLLIQRTGFSSRLVALEKGRCSHCSTSAHGVWE